MNRYFASFAKDPKSAKDTPNNRYITHPLIFFQDVYQKVFHLKRKGKKHISKN